MILSTLSKTTTNLVCRLSVLSLLTDCVHLKLTKLKLTTLNLTYDCHNDDVMMMTIMVAMVMMVLMWWW